MKTREALKKMQQLGFKVSEIAKEVNKSASTIQKWVNGTINLSNETEIMVTLAVKNILNEFNNIKID